MKREWYDLRMTLLREQEIKERCEADEAAACDERSAVRNELDNESRVV
jgi:hypothetical protein